MIDRFTGDYRFLSNFYPVQILDPFDGLVFPSVEHAYQAAKTLDLVWRQRFQRGLTAGQAKALGRRSPLRQHWEEVKVPLMLGFLRQKFSSPSLSRALLLTGDQPLVEGNTWGDTFWGVVLSPPRHGQNQLGKLLMQVRTERRQGVTGG